MQAKEHDLIKYMVLTYTYPIFTVFREPKMAPFLPSSLTINICQSRRYMRNRHDYDDQYARGVLVYCEGEVSYLACLI